MYVRVVIAKKIIGVCVCSNNRIFYTEHYTTRERVYFKIPAKTLEQYKNVPKVLKCYFRKTVQLWFEMVDSRTKR